MIYPVSYVGSKRFCDDGPTGDEGTPGEVTGEMVTGALVTRNMFAPVEPMIGVRNNERAR